VVNGHQLGPDGSSWPVPPPPRRPFYKRPVGIACIIVGCLVVLGAVATAGVIVGVLNQDQSPASATPTTSSTAATVEASPSPTAYDAATATTGERWSRYTRLAREDDLPIQYWAASTAEEAESGYSALRICQRSEGEYAYFLELLAENSNESQMELTHRGQLFYTQAYCPERTPGYEAAWAAH